MYNKITGLVLIAAMTLSGCSESEKAEVAVNNFEVIVVGAGAAGMYAAYTLNRAGVKVKVLEASSTHGGRAQNNQTFGQGFVSIGPEEIYSSPDFPVSLRKQALDAIKAEVEEDGADWSTMKIKGDSVFVDGEVWGILPDSGQFKVDLYRDLYAWDSTKLHPFELGTETDIAMFEDSRDDWREWPFRGQNNYDDHKHLGLKNIAYMIDGKLTNAEDDNTYREVADEFYAIIGDYDGPDTTYTAVLKLAGVDSGSVKWLMMEDIFGTSISASSLNRIYTNKGHGDWGDGGGHVYLADLSYKDFLDTLYFHEIHEKEIILYNSAVETIDYSGDRVTVLDENGVSYTADYVISTVSVEVLKSGIIEFIPALPAEKAMAYGKMTMDAGWRLYLKFKEPIWDKEEIIEILTMGYSSRCWVPAKWRGEGVGDPNVLTCYIMGERAEYLMGPEVDMDKVVLKELDVIFGGTTASDNFIESFHMNYKMNPYIGGVYTYPQKDMYPVDGPSVRQILAKSIDDKLFFGGTATNNAHSSTVFGAMETGLRTAEEVLAVKK
ncbi:MAG: FAD-dependent oxidoreductase [Flavobacteriales bacterium]|nr:FAD-dependent oxidoreductase [Flavobacteriales bacterium]